MPKLKVKSADSHGQMFGRVYVGGRSTAQMIEYRPFLIEKQGSDSHYNFQLEY